MHNTIFKIKTSSILFTPETIPNLKPLFFKTLEIFKPSIQLAPIALDMAAREQALSLLAAANNHGDLAVKLSSLKQAKDILVSIEPGLAADLFPFLVELYSSHESLVRKAVIEYVSIFEFFFCRLF